MVTHPDSTEEDYQYADSVAPSRLREEVPEDILGELKAALIAEAKRINQLPPEEVKRLLKQHMTNN